MKVRYEDKETECGTVSLRFRAENNDDSKTLEKLNADQLPVEVERDPNNGKIKSLALRMKSKGPRIYEQKPAGIG